MMYSSSCCCVMFNMSQPKK